MRIQAQGNHPEEWLEYTNFLLAKVSFSDQDTRASYISNTFAKAIKVRHF